MLWACNPKQGNFVAAAASLGCGNCLDRHPMFFGGNCKVLPPIHSKLLERWFPDSAQVQSSISLTARCSTLAGAHEVFEAWRGPRRDDPLCGCVCGYRCWRLRVTATVRVPVVVIVGCQAVLLLPGTGIGCRRWRCALQGAPHRPCMAAHT